MIFILANDKGHHQKSMLGKLSQFGGLCLRKDFKGNLVCCFFVERVGWAVSERILGPPPSTRRYVGVCLFPAALSSFPLLVLIKVDIG